MAFFMPQCDTPSVPQDRRLPRFAPLLIERTDTDWAAEAARCEQWTAALPTAWLGLTASERGILSERSCCDGEDARNPGVVARCGHDLVFQAAVSARRRLAEVTGELTSQDDAEVERLIVEMPGSAGLARRARKDRLDWLQRSALDEEGEPCIAGNTGERASMAQAGG